MSREENSIAFYLKSETDSYYFSLAIWNSNTKEYPDNYASAIRHNVICCGEWQKHVCRQTDRLLDIIWAYT